MTAREYLGRLRALGSAISQKKQELDALHEIAMTIRSFDYAQDKVQTSPGGEAPFAKTAERAAELDEEICALEDERLAYIDKIHALDDDRYVTVLYLYYAGALTLYEVAGVMNYSYRHIIRIHAEALEAFEERWHTMSL